MAHVYNYQTTTITGSYKNRLDLAMSEAVNSSIQVALLVIPFLVLLGWIIGQPLSLCEYYSTIKTLRDPYVSYHSSL